MPLNYSRDLTFFGKSDWTKSRVEESLVDYSYAYSTHKRKVRDSLGFDLTLVQLVNKGNHK